MTTTNRAMFKLFGRHLRPYAGITTLLVAVIAAAEFSQTLIIWRMGVLVDAMTTKQGPVILYLVLFISFYGLFWLLWRTSGLLASVVQPRVVHSLIVTAYRSILPHSYDFFTNHFSGALVRRALRLGNSFRVLAESALWKIIPLTVSLIGMIVMIALRSWTIALVMVVWTILMIGYNFLTSRRKLRFDIDRAQKDSHVTAVLSDSLANSINIKLFNGQTQEIQDVAAAVESLRLANTKSWRAFEKGHIGQAVINFVTLGVIMTITFRLWQRDALSIGDFVLIHTSLTMLFGKLFEIGRTMRDIYEALADAKEMMEIMELEPEIQDKRGAKTLRVTAGKIEFQAVEFAYHRSSRNVLDQFSLTIDPNERVALVGSSGAGKSTVVKLLFRFYDPTRGQILIDGQSIAKVTQTSLREAVALVPQEPVLFHRTLKDNIRYGRFDATDAEIQEAAKAAHCHEFISQLAHGYDTFVGERGVKLSGGERQRVAIARAILRNAPILVLDEATSSLDSESEALIQDALKHLMHQKTAIVIAHRLSTIMQMDRLIVMDGGKVVDMGTHAELVKRSGIYQKLWEIQAGGFAK